MSDEYNQMLGKRLQLLLSTGLQILLQVVPYASWSALCIFMQSLTLNRAYDEPNPRYLPLSI